MLRRTLRTLRFMLLCCPEAARALVPYYRQILPTLSLVMLLEPRGKVEFEPQTHKKLESIHDLVTETLMLLERHGGRDAFVNIKYMIPVHESSTQ